MEGGVKESTHGRSGYMHGMVHGGIAKEQAMYLLGKREGGSYNWPGSKRRFARQTRLLRVSWLVGPRSFDNHLTSPFRLAGPCSGLKISENDRPCPASPAGRARSLGRCRRTRPRPRPRPHGQAPLHTHPKPGRPWQPKIQSASSSTLQTPGGMPEVNI